MSGGDRRISEPSTVANLRHVFFLGPGRTFWVSSRVFVNSTCYLEDRPS